VQSVKSFDLIVIIVFTYYRGAVNIRDLEYFLAVAEFQHFGKAAKHCHVSQPTLSGQLKSTISSIQDIHKLAHSFTNPLSGQFRLGGIPTISTYVFPEVVSEVRSLMPDLSLILIEDKTRSLVDQLNKGEIDAAIMALPIEYDFLVSQALYDDAFYLAVPEGHELSGLECAKLEHLQDNQLLLLEEGHCLRGQAIEACNTININEYDFMATSLETLRLMVKAGTGMTIMPEMAIQKDEKGIHYLPFESNSFKRKVGLVWRKTTVRKPVIDVLLGLLRNRS